MVAACANNGEDETKDKTQLKYPFHFDLNADIASLNSYKKDELKHYTADFMAPVVYVTVQPRRIPLRWLGVAGFVGCLARQLDGARLAQLNTHVPKSPIEGPSMF